MTGLGPWAEILRRGRVAWIALFGAGLLLAGAGAVSAYWAISTSLSPTSLAMAQAGALTAPTSPSATDSGGGVITVRWSLPPTQLSGAGYRVTRTSGPGSGTIVCVVASTATSCQDTGLGAGTAYGYTVEAVIGTSWRSASISASATTLGVSTLSLPAGTVGATYSTRLAAIGGSASYTSWSVGAGALPGWATLNPGTGDITGTPTAVGTVSGLRFTVRDSLGRTATSGSLTLTVGKGNQVITFTSAVPSAPTVGGATYVPTAKSSAGLPVLLSVDVSSASVCSMSAGVVTFTRVGTCLIDANQAGSADYNAAAQVQQSIAIGKGSQSITFTSSAPGSATAGGATYVPTARATSGLPVVLTVRSTSASVCSISAGVVSFTAVGTCLLDANQAGNADYNAAAQVQQSFTVARGSQTVTFTSIAPADAGVRGTYVPTATSSSGLVAVISIDSSSSSVCSISGGVVSFQAVGSCKVNANQPGSPSFSPAPQVQQSVTIAAPAGLGIVIVGGSGTPVASCGTVSASYTCNVTGVGSGGNVTFSVVFLNSSGGRVVYSYTQPSTITQSGRNRGTVVIAAGASGSDPNTLTASHRANRTRTSTLTFGPYTLTLRVSS